ncbi:Scr1 family TA system antitoxin-like transcriptional regulator [Streptomyces sp. NPDC092903]|uniref:Scr1 family TA system antitoxin-like transcriptional regulator n=1 Tax=Streptomyces sp. NPDC092903 TaxID=3366017 RepID=UPI0037FB672B
MHQWTTACGRSDAYDELRARLAGSESHIRSWRRQLVAGHEPVQDAYNRAQANSKIMRTWESSWIVGILQTPDYARARIGRQELVPVRR